MDRFRLANREMWDRLTPIHAASDFYDMEAFLRGDCTLQTVEVEEVGDVDGKSLLHLQCHFGQDTLSWARRGANVVGTDFSEPAITLARSLADELKLDARFICCDLYDLPRHLDGEYDIVFTSAGVLCWLPDLTRWAGVITHFLRPGGIFYIREFHPMAGVFDDDPPVTEPRFRYPYFPSKEPLAFDDAGSYADPEAPIRAVSYEWPHSLGEIITTLATAGLRIEYLHEFPFSGYQSHPFLTRGQDGLWRYEEGQASLPLSFSIRAVKPQ